MTKCRGLMIQALLVTGAFLALLPFVSQPAQAGSWTILREGFEGDITEWAVSDENPVAGLDLWGVSTAASHSGTGSVWCAYVGNSSVNGRSNHENGYYDEDMDANLVANLGDVSGFDSLSLSFWYWAITGSVSLDDFLSVWYLTSDNWTRMWAQPSVDSDGWQQITFAIPPETTAVSFVFHSESTVGLGPYEGAYVDDVTVTGDDAIPPQSSVTGLPTFIGSGTFPVGFSATDNVGGSGLLSIRLLYRINGGGWTLFQEWNATGTITFLAPSDGVFEFYTIATDRAGNVESAPVEADASATVDRESPLLTIGNPSGSRWSDATTVNVAWSTAEQGSGVARHLVVLNGGAALDVGTSTNHTFAGLREGLHEVAVTAIDRAGNTFQVSVGFGVDVTAPSVAIKLPTASQDVLTSDVTVSWTGSDAGSGIERYDIFLDDGAPLGLMTGTAHIFRGVAGGTHTVTVVAVDAAGNSNHATRTFRVNASWVTGGGPTGWLPLTSLVLGILVSVFACSIWWRRTRQLTGGPSHETDTVPIEKPGKP